MSANLARRSIAELIGTAFLLAAIVGSGIMGERLAGGNLGIALLANSIATGAALIALILAFGSISGAHFNPLVTLVFALRGDVEVVETPILVVAQLAGAMLGVVLTNIMFDVAPISASRHIRTGSGQWLGEGLATFGLIVVIVLCAQFRPGVVAFAVGAYVTAAYWIVPSTSFANPAVAIGRSMTDTFSGIRPQDVAAFVVAQVSGAIAAAGFLSWIAK